MRREEIDMPVKLVFQENNLRNVLQGLGRAMIVLDRVCITYSYIFTVCMYIGKHITVF